MTQQEEMKTPTRCNETATVPPAAESPLTPYTENMVRAEVDAIIKVFELNPADKDDIAQEFRLALLRSFRKFNPSKASYSTFAARIVKDERRNIMRRKGGGQETFNRSCISLDSLRDAESEDYDEKNEPWAPPEIDAVFLREDVQSVLKTLSPEERAICKALMDGLSLEVACKAGKIGRKTYYEQIRPKLQKIFFEAGFDIF